MRPMAWLVVLAAVAGCSEGPTSGELSLRLTTPRNGDRAVLFAVTGGAERGVTAPSGTSYRVFVDTSAVGDTAWIAVITPAGSSLAPGEIARLFVPDTRKAGNYRATVFQLAASDYTLADTTGVTISIVK